MQKLNENHYEVIKWGAEYSMIYLHFLALAHFYSLAVAIGGLVLIIYSTATIKYHKAIKVPS